MFAQARLRGIVWRWLAPVVGAAALALAVYFYFHTPGQKTVRLTITAGNLLGTRAELASHLTHLGFSADQLKSFLPGVLEFLKSKLPPDVVKQVSAFLPGVGAES